jgi:LuxR family maltose regulon positive regulatory protein
LAELLCEWNDLEAALRHARTGTALCKQWGQADLLAAGYMSLAEVLLGAKETDRALDALQKARQATTSVSPWFLARVDRMGALVHLELGDVGAAGRWARESGLSACDEFGYSSKPSYRTLAQVLIAEGRLGEALHLLGRLLEMAEAAGAAGRAVHIRVLQALALQAQGKLEPALAALEGALCLAEPEGYVRTFVDGADPLRPLLRRAAARGIQVAYYGCSSMPWSAKRRRRGHRRPPHPR